MEKAPRHETPEGYTLIEVETDLWGRLVSYQIEGTPYFLTRTPKGWRGQIQPHGRARRRYQGPGCEDPRQCLRYLIRYGFLRQT